MRRLWLLLALLLFALPDVAAAEPAPAQESRGEYFDAAPGHPVGDGIRGGSGVEILSTTDGRRQTGTRAGQPLGPGPAAAPPRFAPPALLSRDASLPSAEGSAPLCQRLPYHATAPPSAAGSLP